MSSLDAPPGAGPDRPAAPPPRGRPIRLPVTQPARYTALVLVSAVAGVLALVPQLPGVVSALLLMFFIGVGPGCALLSWTGPPGVSRLLVVPALGLGLTIMATTAAATFGWWSPHTLFGLIALVTVWSVVPNFEALVRDMVP